MKRNLFPLAVLLLAAPLLAAQDTPLFVPGPYKDSLPTASDTVDGEWYARQQVAFADLWNGGPDGTQGQGAYLPSFTGYFQPHLDRQWNRGWGEATTVIAQSRGIFGNVEAYVAAQALGIDGSRFLTVAEKGGGFLLDRFRDPKHGGYYWKVSGDTQKQGYGQMHAWLALSRLAAVSPDPRWKVEATRQFDLIQKHFVDPEWPGAVLPGKSRDFGRVQGVKNIDTFTHYFETLQAYLDVAPEERKAEVFRALLAAGNLLVTRLAVAIPSDPTLKMVAYNYADDWTISREPYSRDTQWSGAEHASPGHAAELAFLISRAVERGCPEAWLSTGRALLDGVVKYANHSVTGGMVYETMGYDMRPLEANPDNGVYIYWAQGENLRALMHWSLVRDPAYRQGFLRAQAFVTEVLADREFGDWYQEIDATTLKPSRVEKGDNWKGDYHEAMLMAEALRLAPR